jgi:hypothetical protein
VGDRIEFNDIPFNASFPDELKAIIAEWPGIWKSPYSLSLYDTGDKDWGYTPLGSLRVSDHWNFMDDLGRRHCPTRGEQPLRNHWALARFEDGKYVIICQFKKVNNRRDRKAARAAKSSI